MVDRLSKYTHFLGLYHPFSAKDVTDLFIREIVRLHGVPSSIVYDIDPEFLSMFWKTLFKTMGTALRMSFAYRNRWADRGS